MPQLFGKTFPIPFPPVTFSLVWESTDKKGFCPSCKLSLFDKLECCGSRCWQFLSPFIWPSSPGFELHAVPSLLPLHQCCLRASWRQSRQHVSQDELFSWRLLQGNINARACTMVPAWCPSRAVEGPIRHCSQDCYHFLLLSLRVLLITMWVCPRGCRSVLGLSTKVHVLIMCLLWSVSCNSI